MNEFCVVRQTDTAGQSEPAFAGPPGLDPSRDSSDSSHDTCLGSGREPSRGSSRGSFRGACRGSCHDPSCELAQQLFLFAANFRCAVIHWR